MRRPVTQVWRKHLNIEGEPLELAGLFDTEKLADEFIATMNPLLDPNEHKLIKVNWSVVTDRQAFINATSYYNWS